MHHLTNTAKQIAEVDRFSLQKKEKEFVEQDNFKFKEEKKFSIFERKNNWHDEMISDNGLGKWGIQFVEKK